MANFDQPVLTLRSVDEDTAGITEASLTRTHGVSADLKGQQHLDGHPDVTPSTMDLSTATAKPADTYAAGTQMKLAVRTTEVIHDAPTAETFHALVKHPVTAPPLAPVAAPVIVPISAPLPALTRPVASHQSDLAKVSHIETTPEKSNVPAQAPVGETELMSDTDRMKAATWAASTHGPQREGFLPDLVLKTGFQIRSCGFMWVPLSIGVDYENQRFTFTYADNLNQLLRQKPLAHRLDLKYIQSEKPETRKRRYPASEQGNRLHFSQRRIELQRTDGSHQKYHLLAPNKEYRDRMLDVIFAMHHPASSTSL